jgi:hypothetical protein
MTAPTQTGQFLELLQRTRTLSVSATALLAMWLCGNLYEELVSNARLLADPVPGAVPPVFAVGSPVFYYLPWAPLCLITVVMLRIRFAASLPAWVRRRLSTAVTVTLLAVVIKIGLITQLNPFFRDPGLAPDLVRRYAIGWEIGNGLAIAAVATALVLLTSWRRVPPA